MKPKPTYEQVKALSQALANRLGLPATYLTVTQSQLPEGESYQLSLQFCTYRPYTLVEVDYRVGTNQHFFVKKTLVAVYASADYELPDTYDHDQWVELVCKLAEAAGEEVAKKNEEAEARAQEEAEQLAARPRFQDFFAGLTECPLSGLNYDYDEGDNRAYGRLEVTFDVPFGKVKFTTMIGSGSEFEESQLFVNDQEVEYEEKPDVGAPHYYAGSRAVNRFVKNAHKTLAKDFQEWLNNHLEGEGEE